MYILSNLLLVFMHLNLCIYVYYYRLFSIFYIICSVLIVATAIGNFGAIKVELVNDKKILKMLSTKLDMTSLKQMSTKKIVVNNKTQREVLGVDKIEFLTAMLVQMNGLNKDRDIEPWLKVIIIYSSIMFYNI
jgi:hypothetical protein